MKAIALFALLAVASAVDYYGTLLQNNQRWNKDIWNRIGYGSVIGGYGIGLPLNYGQQIYGQSYYNPISYAFGIKPEYSYSYLSPIQQQYGVQSIGLSHLGSYGKSFRVEPVSQTTFSSVQPVVQSVVQPVVQSVAQPVVQTLAQPIVQSLAQPVVQPLVQPAVQPIVSKTFSTVVEQPQVHVQGKNFISQTPFTSYFHRGADIVKPEISTIKDINVADVAYKTVQQPISHIVPQVQVQPIVSSFKTVQEPAFVSQYATGLQDSVINYDVPKVSSYSSYEVPKVGVYNYEVPKVGAYNYEIPKVGAYNYEIPKVGAYNYEIPKVGAYNYEIPKVGAYNYELPRVNSYSYSTSQQHVVGEPKLTATHTVTQEDYQK